MKLGNTTPDYRKLIAIVDTFNYVFGGYPVPFNFFVRVWKAPGFYRLWRGLNRIDDLLEHGKSDIPKPKY